MVEKRVATLAADAINGKELAEKRANDVLKMVEVKVDSRHEKGDAQTTPISRSLFIAIICIILLGNTVILTVLAVKINVAAESLAARAQAFGLVCP